MSFLTNLAGHRYFPIGLFVIFLMLSIPMRFSPATPDVSWLIDMCARMLNGEKAYVDIFETTPPVPTLLYMPGAFIEKWTPLGAEAATYIFAYLSAIIALFLSFKILPKEAAEGFDNRWAIILPAAFFLFIVTHKAFAQREYFSAAFALPIVSVFMRHTMTGNWGQSNHRLWAALLAGLSVAIKPPIFILPGIVLAAYYLVATRNVRFVYSSGLGLAAAISGIITITSLLAFPEFLHDLAPMMREIYVPVRAPLTPFSREELMIVVLGLALTFFMVLTIKSARENAPLMITSIGFVIVYALQGKFFGYHILPAAFFMITGLFCAVIHFLKKQANEKRFSPVGIAALPIAIWFTLRLFVVFDDDNPYMTDLAWAQGFEQPTAMSITPFIGVGFPLARQIDAVWVNRIHSQWASNYARLLLEKGGLSPEQKAIAEKYYFGELDRARRVIHDRKPDILIQSVADSVNWLNEEMLAREPDYLDDYEIIAEEGVFRIWARREALEAQ